IATQKRNPLIIPNPEQFDSNYHYRLPKKCDSGGKYHTECQGFSAVRPASPQIKRTGTVHRI
ncbi:hypothetical protein, partial [Klebsiella variicola]|uniref:hypothetical protein n=1 Tax=Klebsiella variicola TaxID=244366 RepID=UPI002B062460